MRRDLYASEAATVDSVKAGFSAMADEMRMSGSTTAWLVCDTRHALSGKVAEAIGAEAAAGLGKRGSIQLGELGMLLFYTDRTLPRGAKNAVILACHPSKQLIGKLDAFRDASAR